MFGLKWSCVGFAIALCFLAGCSRLFDSGPKRYNTVEGSLRPPAMNMQTNVQQVAAAKQQALQRGGMMPYPQGQQGMAYPGAMATVPLQQPSAVYPTQPLNQPQQNMMVPVLPMNQGMPQNMGYNQVPPQQQMAQAQMPRAYPTPLSYQNETKNNDGWFTDRIMNWIEEEEPEMTPEQFSQKLMKYPVGYPIEGKEQIQVIQKPRGYPEPVEEANPMPQVVVKKVTPQPPQASFVTASYPPRMASMPAGIPQAPIPPTLSSRAIPMPAETSVAAEPPAQRMPLYPPQGNHSSVRPTVPTAGHAVAAAAPRAPVLPPIGSQPQEVTMPIEVPQVGSAKGAAAVRGGPNGAALQAQIAELERELAASEARSGALRAAQAKEAKDEGGWLPNLGIGEMFGGDEPEKQSAIPNVPPYDTQSGFKTSRLLPPPPKNNPYGSGPETPAEVAALQKKTPDFIPTAPPVAAAEGVAESDSKPLHIADKRPGIDIPLAPDVGSARRRLNNVPDGLIPPEKPRAGSAGGYLNENRYSNHSVPQAFSR